MKKLLLTLIGSISTVYASPIIFNQDILHAEISYLTSDQLQGRFSLAAGDKKAIEWIVTQFEQAGLKPANGKSYLQPVPLVQYVPDEKNSYIALHRDNKSYQWQEPTIFSDFRRNLSLKAKVVFAGYGITAPALHYDDYQNIDVHGKIVLLFEHEPQEENAASIFNGKANTRFATNRIKILNAQAHGAVAVIIAPEPNRKHPSNQQRYQSIGSDHAPMPTQVLQDDSVHIPYAIISDEVANQIAGKKLLSQWQTLIDKNLQPQSKLLPNTQIIMHLVNKAVTQGTTYNVVGLLVGSDPKLKAETIILSAHHDHDGMSGGKMWRGADDNASGTVGVVALAHAFAKQPAPKRSILFVVFAAEERGLLGAYYMVKHPLRPLATTRAMLNFDMIGRNEADTKQTHGLIAMPADTSNRLNLIGGHYSPDYLRVVTEQNRQVGLILDNRFDNETALNVFFRSDQFPFVLKNIPAFWWFTGFHNDYHQPSDTAEKINYVKMSKILQLAYLSAKAFANSNDFPKFIENPK